MSQNWFTNENGRRVLYGYDSPTGGFFYSEFPRDDEPESELEELKSYSEAQTLTQLLEDMKSNFECAPSLGLLISQFKSSLYPTELQLNVGKMFGKDIRKSLEMVYADLLDNYSEYFLDETTYST